MRTTITLDRIDPRSQLPKPGDVLTTTRCAYRVLDVRPVEPRAWTDRWSIDVDKLGDLPIRDEWLQPDTVVVATSSYRHGDGPADIARRAGLRDEHLVGAEQLHLAGVDVPPAVHEPASPDARYLEPHPDSVARTIGVPAIAEIRAALHAATPGGRP